jgi:hypothetical protein
MKEHLFIIALYGTAKITSFVFGVHSIYESYLKHKNININSPFYEKPAFQFGYGLFFTLVGLPRSVKIVKHR